MQYNLEELGAAVADAAARLGKDPVGRVLVQMSSERGCTYADILREYERSPDLRSTVVLRLASCGLANIERQINDQVAGKAPAPKVESVAPQVPDRIKREICPGCQRSRAPGGPWSPPRGVWALPVLCALLALMSFAGHMPQWLLLCGAIVAGVLVAIIWRALTIRPCQRTARDESRAACDQEFGA